MTAPVSEASAIAVVTCVYDLGLGEPYKDLVQRFWDMMALLPRRVPVIVFCEPDTPGMAPTVLPPNVHVVTRALASFTAYARLTAGTGPGTDGAPTASLQPPTARNVHKDTPKYMALMNSKMEMVAAAATHPAVVAAAVPVLAWMDAGIIKIVKNRAEVSHALQQLVEHGPAVSRGIVLAPGCWARVVRPSPHGPVCWRFCGGLFFVSIESVADVAAASLSSLTRAYVDAGLTTWEVNAWARSEADGDVAFAWYAADHNDTMFTNVPVTRPLCVTMHGNALP